MQLLDSYVQAVKFYLPRAGREDIARELSANLLAQMEERQELLGRPLTEEEEMEFLREHGDPMLVARHYRQDRPSLSIGIELIGPELFPIYLMILGLNLTLALSITAIFVFASKAPFTLEPFVPSFFMQVFCVTLVFTILNWIRRKYPQPWYYPPAALSPHVPIARWVSLSGLVIWSVFTVWWTAVPYAPVLLFGGSANGLQLAASWHRFYFPILLLLLAGIAQRAINLARPDWTWLLPTARTVINAIALAMQIPMIHGYPFVMVKPAVWGQPHFERLAEAYSNIILWGVLSWLWIYFLINGVVFARYSVPHVRRWFSMRQRRAAVAL
jgi:hypothetical protein